MLCASAVSLYYAENDFSGIFIASVITLLISGLSFYLTRNENIKRNPRETYLIFIFLGIFFSLFGALPYLLTNPALSFTDTLFESVSGFTSTGSSIFPNIESLSHGLLFWRAETQWLGGICFIIISLLILKSLSISGVNSFEKEIISFRSEKLNARRSKSIIWLIGIYLLLTIAETIALKCGGMSFFDAVCHSFSTISTGGFSTKTEGISYWNSPTIEYVLIVFMYLSGINFAIFFYLVVGKFKKLKNEEFLYYTLFILLFSMITALVLFFVMHETAANAIRTAFFEISSITSTTGYYVADIKTWRPMFLLIMLVLMFWGACYGSAGGSVKTIRIIMIIKNSFLELKRFRYPNAMFSIRIDKQLVPLTVVNNAFLFLLLYLFVCVVGIVSMSFYVELADAVKIVLISIGNIGLGIGHDFSSISGFNVLPNTAKYILMLLMLMGRVELFAFFILFTRSFWK